MSSSNNTSNSSNNSKTTTTSIVSSLATTAAVAVVTTTAVWWIRHYRRQQYEQRTKWMLDKANEHFSITKDTLPSIFENFCDTKLGLDSTISEANKKRTQVYYERARDAHVYDLCPGVRSYPRLRNRREATVRRLMRYYTQRPAKSHRTVICMCDTVTAQLLDQARAEILAPLEYSTDMATEGVWIPPQSIIPPQHMHVTVAILWWWHTMRDDNRDLSRALVGRLRQALVSEFHYAFQIELERIVLLGGCALVALWRCIGQRQIKNCNNNHENSNNMNGTNSNGSSSNNGSSNNNSLPTSTTSFTIFDRHGEEVDPFVKLRRDIVRFITDPDPNIKLEPLTYQHLKAQQEQQQEMELQKEHKDDCEPSPTLAATPTPSNNNRPPFERSDSIEIKTPGLGESQDGFIHTTLARLPLDCLSMTDTELAPIHRLCREASATYCGHRMVISSFRVIETIGAGGESNPCVNPIFDETIHAPVRVEVVASCTGMMEQADLHATRKEVDQHATVGGMRHRKVLSRGDTVNLNELFAEPPTPALPPLAPSSRPAGKSRSSSFSH